MKTSKISLKLKLALPVGLVALAIFSVMTLIIANSSHESTKKNAEQFLLAAAEADARVIQMKFEKALEVAKVTEQVVFAKKKMGLTQRQIVINELNETLTSNPDLIGTWVGFEPNVWDGKDAEFVEKPGHDKSGRFIPYWSYDKGVATLSPLVDYEKAGDGDYYQVPKNRKKESVVEPYIYPIAGIPTLMTSVAVPFLVNDQFIGVAGVDLSLKSLKEDVEKVKPYAESQAYVVSSSGKWVTHPREDLIAKPAEFAVESEKIKTALQTGKAIQFTGFDDKLNKEFMYVVYPIKMGSTEIYWSLVLTTPTSVVFAEADALFQKQILMSAVGLLLLLGAVFLVATFISKELTQLSEKLSTSNQQVSGAIHSLTAAGQELSAHATESASSLEEAVASLEEMTSMVKLNSENARQAATLSNNSSDEAIKGESEIHSLISSMKEISESSKKIEEIINVIDDIAFQTNLLSLNAAVEAARAGEQGKGFSVVAEAVRALAQRSSVAAKDITGLIKESVTKIEVGTAKADRSGDVLKNIVLTVKKVSELNNAISLASEEQAAGIQQISIAMNQIDQSVQKNASSSANIATTADEINQQANHMALVVDNLNVEVYGESRKVA